MGYSSDLCTGGTATASSEQSTREASKGFDDDTGSRWQSNAPAAQWIKYQFAQAEPISKVRINPYMYAGNASIRNFTIDGSNNDADWTTLYTGEHPDESGWRDFTFSNSTAYLYIKINITTTWNANPALFEVEMMEVVSQKTVTGRYAILKPSVKPLSAMYAVTQTAQKTMKGIYQNTQAAARPITAFYHVRPPVVEIYDVTDGAVIDLLSMGLMKSGEISAEFILHLWNGKGGSDPALQMKDVYITASLADGSYSGGADADGNEFITEKWLEVKSSGVTGSNIVDDAQASFTPVGGEPSTGGLAIGPIPSDAARHLHCRVNLPAQPSTLYKCRPRIVVNCNPMPWPGFGDLFGYYFGL
ncbi:MAG: hypothetical protein IEMM0002_1474 [bacterium]|nr:MAG: hypothetical protein IEMM0002_1474 [bacterium]